MPKVGPPVAIISYKSQQYNSWEGNSEMVGSGTITVFRKSTSSIYRFVHRVRIGKFLRRTAARHDVCLLDQLAPVLEHLTQPLRSCLPQKPSA